MDSQKNEGIRPNPSDIWGLVGAALGVHLGGVTLFAVGVWVMVLMDWMRILSGGGVILSMLLLLGGILLYLVSFPFVVGATIAAFWNKYVLAGLVSLLLAVAVFVEGYYAGQRVLQDGLHGLIALFGGSGLRF
jgi:hypothetical protein